MPQHAHRPDDHARLCDLSHGEHMLLWAFRAAAFGAGDCRLVRRQFEESCGPLGIEALTALTVFVRELGLSGRRKITLAAPGSYRLTRDEQSVLALFAAGAVALVLLAQAYAPLGDRLERSAAALQGNGQGMEVALSGRVKIWGAAACMIRVANAVEPSNCAAARPGPNTGIPCSRTTSATPATSGASGPITTRSTACSSANSRTAAPSSGSTSTSVASCAIPAFPGAQRISCASASARRARMIACSRAPEPRTRIFTPQAYRAGNDPKAVTAR